MHHSFSISRYGTLLIASWTLITAGPITGKASELWDDRSAWLPAVESTLIADQYPTAELAAQGVAQQVASLYFTAVSSVSYELQLEVDPSVEPGTRMMIERILNPALNKISDGESDSPPSTQNRQVVFVHLKQSPPTPVPTSSDVANSAIRQDLALVIGLEGEIQIELRHGESHEEFRARYLAKPWLSMDVGAVPKGTAIVRGLATTDERPEHLEKLAIEQEILPRIVKWIQQQDTERGVPPRQLDEHWQQIARRQIDRYTTAGSPLFLDRFRQAFRSPVLAASVPEDFTVLEREMALVDVSDETIKSLAISCDQAVRHVFSRKRVAWFTGTACIGASVLLGSVGYGLINWMTRGYYVWRLRACTMAFIAVAATFAARLAMAIAHVR